MNALKLGLTLGLLIEMARKLLKSNRRYKEFSKGSRRGRVADFTVDAFLLPSPYASSFGGFVELLTTIWFAAGGVLSSVYDWAMARANAGRAKDAEGELPADMSTMSLVGGGLIAGESLSALSVGLAGLIASGALMKLLSGG
jgi:hypothetical protein